MNDDVSPSLRMKQSKYAIEKPLHETDIPKEYYRENFWTEFEEVISKQKDEFDVNIQVSYLNRIRNVQNTYLIKCIFADFSFMPIELLKLKDGLWLNDSLINSYMAILSAIDPQRFGCITTYECKLFFKI